MDSRAQGLHASADRLCTFFAALALELERHEEREAKIDESGEQRVSRRCGDNLWEVCAGCPLASCAISDWFHAFSTFNQCFCITFLPRNGLGIHSRKNAPRDLRFS